MLDRRRLNEDRAGAEMRPGARVTDDERFWTMLSWLLRYNATVSCDMKLTDEGMVSS